MKRSVLALASFVTLSLTLTACGGGGGGGTTPTPVTPGNPTPQPNSKASASVKVSFTVPVPTGHTNPSSSARGVKAVRRLKSLSSRKPLYVSPDTKGFFIFLDGTAIFGTVSTGSSPNTPATFAPGGPYNANANSIPGGGTASYTVTQQTATAPTPTPGQGCTVTTCSNPYTYDTVTATMDVLPGSHTIGAVLTAADGFVLSEDQESVTLNGGSNPAVGFFLKGVADSAFWCDAACDGGDGNANADGSYTLQVFATDHEGDAIPYQLSGSTPISLDNGPVTLVETDSNNVVTITPAGPFTNPGNDNQVSYTEAGQSSIASGWLVNIKCNSVSTTTVAVKVGTNNSGGVNGFNYSADIDSSKDPVDPNAPTYNPSTTPTTRVYTNAGQYIDTVPVQQDFGNELQVNCDAALNLTFE
ncbi:MAG TPA: hypothetical protein VHT05_13275 [Candidatus Elarobacter sp.]|jgi:hypothetical protein|nr:hypothetical protein [Candidatus Elarobacter sp.]